MSERPERMPTDAASSIDAATRFKAAALAQAAGGRVLCTGSAADSGGAVDSRLVTPGAIFFALPGERTDGHRYLADAVAAGAGALVVTEDLPPERLIDL